LSLPYQQNIKDGNFKCLQIEGIPKDKAGFFFVNFNKATPDGDNDEVAVSFEFCFNHKGRKNQIVGYTYANGRKTNSQVFDGNFPFKTQTPFEMEIRKKDDLKALKVFVNDAKIWEYPISIEISTFAAVRVGGDFDLRNFKIEVDK
ncbi:hypothetical protein Bpfe_005545, partial [Biomphalaria pfeifferi]